MSILDKAKNQLQSKLKGFGEETIRVMDAVDEERPKKPAKQPRVKPEKPAPVKREKVERAPKSPRNSILSRPNRPIKPEIVVEEDYDEVEETVEYEPEVVEETVDENAGSSAFAVDEEQTNFFKNMDRKHKKKMKEYESVPVPIPDAGKVQDILEILNIPATFEIENDIFLPVDLEDIGFDLQVPQGYEMGEVDTFVSRVKITVAKFVELLNLRNEHVAKLATVVDRLQVDVSNIKLQSEIANGINIMPTNDDEDYEQANFELKLIIRRLEEQLQNQTNDDRLSSEERDTFDRLQDELSVKNRELKDLEDEVYELKNQLAMVEEGNDFDTAVDDDGYSAFEESGPIENEYYIEGSNSPINQIEDDEDDSIDELYSVDENQDYDNGYDNNSSYGDDNYIDQNDVNQGVGFVDNQIHADDAFIDNNTVSNYDNDDSISFDDFDENADYTNTVVQNNDSYDNNDYEGDNSDSIDFDFSSDIEEDDSDNGFEGLPDVDFDSDEEQPLISQNQRPADGGNRAFYSDDESLNDFMVRNQQYYDKDEDDNSAIDFVDDNGQAYQTNGPVGTYYDPDEEEDELDKLQNWGNK